MFFQTAKFVLVLLLSFTFTFATWAKSGASQKVDKSSVLEDKVEIQTIVFQTELYREYKKQITDSISIREQRVNKIAEDWNETEWDQYLDNLVQNNLIFKVEHPEEKEKKKITKLISDGIKSGVNGIFRSTVSMGRKSGVTAVIAYLGGTAAGYALMGLGMAISSAGMVAFFSVFPLGTIAATAIIAIQALVNKRQERKAFNTSDDGYDYYKEYKSIQKTVMSELKIKKGELIYAIDTDQGLVLAKKSLFRSLFQLVGFGKKNISIINLRRALRKNNLYNDEIKKILKGKDLTYYEKLISALYYIDKNFSFEDKESVLSRFGEKRIYNLPVVKQMLEITEWGREVTLIDDLNDLPLRLKSAPKGIGFISVVRVYKDFILPKLSERFKGVYFNEFKCLRRNLWGYIAHGYKQSELVWDIENKKSQELFKQVESCI